MNWGIVKSATLAHLRGAHSLLVELWSLARVLGWSVRLTRCLELIVLRSAEIRTRHVETSLISEVVAEMEVIGMTVDSFWCLLQRTSVVFRHRLFCFKGGFGRARIVFTIRVGHLQLWLNVRMLSGRLTLRRVFVVLV